MAHRAQTLAFIKLSNIYETTKGLATKIPEMIKTSGPGRFSTPLSPSYNQRESNVMCGICDIKIYRND